MGDVCNAAAAHQINLREIDRISVGHFVLHDLCRFGCILHSPRLYRIDIARLQFFTDYAIRKYLFIDLAFGIGLRLDQIDHDAFDPCRAYFNDTKQLRVGRQFRWNRWYILMRGLEWRSRGRVCCNRGIGVSRCRNARIGWCRSSRNTRS